MFALTSCILIVDDMSTMRKLIIKQLKELGFSNFKEADNGSSGWESISNADPSFDLVISDWNMPHSSGLDLLKRVRADSRFKKLPFLMITAEAEKHQIVEAVQAGISSYILKPFVIDTLKEQLRVAYEKSQ